MIMKHPDLHAALVKHFATEDILFGKGGFWIKGHGFITIAQARTITGVKAAPRNFRGTVSAYGDWAAIAALNRIKL